MEDANDDEEDIRAEALNFKKSNWILNHGLTIIRSGIDGYESGDETYQRIDIVI